MSTKSNNNQNNQHGSLNFQLVYRWARKHLKSNNLLVYNEIVFQSVGYRKSITNNLPYEHFIKELGLSRNTVSKVLKYLKDNNFIKKVASNSRSDNFKVANKYSLVFRKDLDFPYVNLDRDDVSNSSVGSVGSKNKESEEEFPKSLLG